MHRDERSVARSKSSVDTSPVRELVPRGLQRYRESAFMTSGGREFLKWLAAVFMTGDPCFEDSRVRLRPVPGAILHNIQSAVRASRKTPLYKSAHRSIISNTQFRDARIFSGLTREETARFLSVSVRTIGHWETGRARPSYAAFKLLRVYRHGSLIHPAWSKCFINHRGALVTAEGREIKATDLDWLSLLFRRAECMTPLMRERDALKEQIRSLPVAHSAPKWCQKGTVMTLRTAQYDPAKRGLSCVETLALQWFPCDSRVAWAASGRLPSSNRGVSGFRNLSFASLCLEVVPNWHHERIDQNSSGTAEPSPSSRPQSPAAAVFRFAGCAPQYGCDSGSSDLPSSSPQQWHAVGKATAEACKVDQAGFAGASPASRSLERCSLDVYATWQAQGGAQRAMPVRQWQEGQAMPSGVDLNRDASRNAGGAL
ncbi:hypothetical protein NX81_011955 [Xanthomonas vasicola]|nr:hypothetical protein NX81_011955 [Xanthomonas vasicola]